MGWFVSYCFVALVFLVLIRIMPYVKKADCNLIPCMYCHGDSGKIRGEIYETCLKCIGKGAIEIATKKKDFNSIKPTYLFFKLKDILKWSE